MPATVDLRELAIDRGETAAPGMRPKRHLVTRYLVPLVLILGFLALVAWASRDLLFPPRKVTVVTVFSTTSEVRQEGTPLFKAAGWIEPRPTPVRVAALSPGVVEKLLVVEDQPVRKGEPVAELVKDDARLVHQRALADLRLREAELESAASKLKAAKTRLAQPVHLEATLREAEAALAKTETELKNLPFHLLRAQADQQAAQKDYDGKLAAKGVVAGIQIDIAKSKLDSSKALTQELRDRETSLRQEQAALSARRQALKTQLELLADETKAKEDALAQVKAAEARLAQAQVTVDEAKLQLDRMTVRAPVDGRVFRLIAHPGARIGSGMTQMLGHDGSSVVTMYRPEMLQVRVDVRFEDIPHVSFNQPVEIDNPALKTPITGQVLFISSEADIQKNTLEVKVAIANPPSVFKPEMLVDVTFLAPRRPEQEEETTQELRLYIPEQLLEQTDGGTFVWVADLSDQAARKTAVKTGAGGSGGLVEIKHGLTRTSRLIVGNTGDLKDGQRIQVTGEDTTLVPNIETPEKNQSSQDSP